MQGCLWSLEDKRTSARVQFMKPIHFISIVIVAIWNENVIPVGYQDKIS
jgi:hypothetical protein